MDFTSLKLSISLAVLTALILVPFAIVLSMLIRQQNASTRFISLSLIALPLVLPPTVLGYYLLQLFSQQALVGSWYATLFGHSLLFSFEGLLLASLIFNLPFAFQPIHTASSTISDTVIESAWSCGLNHWQTLLHIELPIIWPGVLSAFILTFAHTMGEFGVVLMVGGNITGETKTMAIEIYEQVQMFNNRGAGILSAILLAVSFTAIISLYFLNQILHQGRE